MDRRTFLTTALGAGSFLLSSRIGTAAAVSGLIGPRRGADEPLLVLLELSGGNDGLNTVVPHGDDAYHRARPRIGVAASRVLDLDGYVGLAPELAGLRGEFENGRLAIVQGAGYPQPNRSHFMSMEIWHTARAQGRDSGPGWIGHLANHLWPDQPLPNRLVHVGREVPYALHSTRHPALNLATPENYRWAGNEADIAGLGGPESEPDAAGGDSQIDFLRRVMADAQASSLEVRRAVARYRPAGEYPDSDLAQSLAVVAALVDARIGARVLSVQQRSYDTHAGQVARHAQLHTELDAALAAFTGDLRAKGNDGQVVVLCFSEFGRRVQENGSQGTDHGTAGPMFVLGTGVKGGLFGRHPSLSDLDERGDLVHTTDFRAVYGTLVDRHFGGRHADVLGARYDTLDFLPAPKRR